MKNMLSVFGGARAANLESIAYLVLLAMAFLLPVFFLPSISAPFQFTKTLIVITGTLIALVAFVVAKLRDGNISIPVSLAVGGAWLVAAAYALSGLFTVENPLSAFIGQRFEIDTVIFMVMMALLLTITPLIIVSKKRALHLILVVLLSGAVLMIYQVLRFIGGADFLSFDIFTATTSNLLGKWNDLGIYSGLIVILSLFAIGMLPFGRLIKILTSVLMIVALFVAAVVNFTPVWIALGLFSLGLFIQGFLRRSEAKRVTVMTEERAGEAPKKENSRQARVSLSALFVLIVSLLFVLQGDGIGNSLADGLGIAQLEARPSWPTTVAIASDTYKENLVFGSGPNTFTEQWARFKPTAVNETTFWNVDFTAGIGTIPTSFVTTGVLGAAAWVIFLLLLLYAGFRGVVLRPAEDKTAYHLAIVSFVVMVYLFALSVVYVTNVVLFSLAFLFAGIFLSMLRFSAAGFKDIKFNFADNPRLGFISVLLLTVVLIAAVIGLYSVSQRYVAAYAFQSSVVEFSINGDLPSTKQHLDRAVTLGQSDTYYRFATQIGLTELNQIIAETDTPLEERRERFQQTLSSTIRNARRAAELAPSNYLNHSALGNVYQTVLPLQIEGAYESALDAYTRAAELAPTNPSIELALAQLEVVRGDTEAARTHIAQALVLKSNYTAAIFLLAQLQIQQGQTADAIRSVEATTVLVPDNAVLFFQLGILRFNVGDSAGANVALERAVEINETYANARYFLGLSYSNQGRTEEAIAQFEIVQELNPDNLEVAAILENLKVGEDPLEGLQTAEAIEDREEPPIEGE